MSNTYLKDNEAKQEHDDGFKEGWNEAIEAAELALHKRLEYPTEACAIVRSLKK